MRVDLRDRMSSVLGELDAWRARHEAEYAALRQELSELKAGEAADEELVARVESLAGQLKGLSDG